MKKILFLLGFILIINTTFSQKWVYSNFIESDSISEITNIERDENNNVYIAGTFYGSITNTSPVLNSHNSSRDIFIAKYDNNLNLLWINQIGSTNDEASYMDLELLPDQTILLTGSFMGDCRFSSTDSLSATHGMDAFLAQYDINSGNLLKVSRIAEGQFAQFINTLEYDGVNLVFSGFYWNPFGGANEIIFNETQDTTLYGDDKMDGFIAKYDENWNYVWAKNIFASNNIDPKSIRVYKGTYYLNGIFQDTLEFDMGTIVSVKEGKYDNFLYKLDSNGVGQWIRRSYAVGGSNLGNIALDENGNVYFPGLFGGDSIYFDASSSTVSAAHYNNSESGGGYDLFINKYNKEGNLQWSKSYGGDGDEWTRGTAYNNGILYMTGYFSDSVYFGEDLLVSGSIDDRNIVLGTFDKDGNMLKAIDIEDADEYDDSGMDIKVDEASNAYMAGYFRSSEVYVEDTTYLNSAPGNKRGVLAKYHPPLSAAFVQDSNITCHGGSDGKLVVKPYFGATPYTYSWSHDGTLTSDTASNLTAGEYTVTVTDALDSTVSITTTLTEPDPITFNGTVTNEIQCYGDSTGAIDIVPAGGTSPYTYFWQTSDGGGVESTTQDQSQLAAGTYDLTITDDNGCTADTSIALSQPDNIDFSASTITHISNDTPEGSIDLEPAGASGSFSNYSWTGPNSFTASTQDISNLTDEGDYNVALQDANSCQFDTTFNVIDSTQMDIFFHPDSIHHVTCNGAADGKATVTVLNPVGSVTFSWTGTSSTDSVAENLGPGKYIVEVTDDERTLTDSVLITEPDPLAISFTSSSTSTVDCYGDTDGVIDVDPSGGTTPYSYSWSNGATSQDQNNLAAGTYSVTLTDANGCTTNDSYTIGEPDALSVNVTIPTGGKITCNGYTDGELEANVSGGTGPNFTYEWNDGASQTGRIADGLGAGTYYVTVTDENGCNASDGRSLSEPDSIKIDNNYSSDISCNGLTDGEIHLSASGGTGTKWFSITPQDETNPDGDFTNLPADIYTISVTDDESCPGPEVKDTIEEPAAITISNVESTDVTGCFGDATGTINVDATGGTGTLSYTLQPDNVNDPNGEFTGLTAGTYTVDVNDGNNCGPVSTGNIVINEPPELTITDTTSTNITCNGGADGSITLTAGGGTSPYTYKLKQGGSELSENGTGEFTGLSAGTYTVDVYDNNTCGPVSTGEIVLTEPAAISITNTTSSDVTCNGSADGSLTVTADGGTEPYNYKLNLDGTLVTDNSTGEFSGLSAGTYVVEVNDANSCGPVSSSEIVINEPSELTITETTSTNTTCNGGADGSITVTAGGGTSPYTYQLNQGGSQVSENNTGEFTGLSAGTYVVEVDDANNCGLVSSSEIVISEPSELTITDTTYTNITCNGGADGSITVTAGGGTSPYTYQLNQDGSQISENSTGEFTGLSAGTYNLSVFDSQSCGPVDTTIILTEPDPIAISNVDSSDVIGCVGDATGMIDIDASGGNGTYTYSISPGNESNGNGEFTDLTAGSYTIEINDAKGCGPVDTTIILSEPSALSINSANGTDVTGCVGDATGVVEVEATGGTGTLTYTLTPGGDSNSEGTFEGLTAGTYTVEVNDEQNCGPVSTDEITINEPDSIQITNIDKDDGTDGNADGSITVTATGGTSPLTYILNPGSIKTNQTGEFTGLADGVYLVSVTDVNNCGPAKSDSITIGTVKGDETGLDDLSVDHGITIYPNPAKEKIILTIDSKELSDLQINFVNALGQIKKTVRIEKSEQKIQKEIGLNSLKDGLYILQFFNSEEYIGKRVLIVN